MLGTKIAFSTSYHPQTDGLAERMIQTMKDIIRRFCAYGMEFKDHEGYTHDWVTLLQAVKLAYNTRQHSTTGKSPSLVEKGWNPLFPVDHLKKTILTIPQQARTSMICVEGLLIQKHPVFLVRLCKPYFQTEEDKFPSRKKNLTPPEIVEVEDSPIPVVEIIKDRKIRLNGKDQRQYLVRFKNQTADTDKWLAEDAIPDEYLQ
ncbi:hypothetical protein O181_009119 [Austropuccinia psidii MF-1]|uniref:Integrase catalytic domain-containing protein n=1 Tax=Austropuccinia psidii MF-1 TaxID=1389203 RepID=A0A9Q3GJI8_9BASI|nr:hypothetical protein [Austropuccinia psidii MF-1]